MLQIGATRKTILRSSCWCTRMPGYDVCSSDFLQPQTSQPEPPNAKLNIISKPYTLANPTGLKFLIRSRKSELIWAWEVGSRCRSLGRSCLLGNFTANWGCRLGYALNVCVGTPPMLVVWSRMIACCKWQILYCVTLCELFCFSRLLKIVISLADMIPLDSCILHVFQEIIRFEKSG